MPFLLAVPLAKNYLNQTYRLTFYTNLRNSWHKSPVLFRLELRVLNTPEFFWSVSWYATFHLDQELIYIVNTSTPLYCWHPMIYFGVFTVWKELGAQLYHKYHIQLRPQIFHISTDNALNLLFHFLPKHGIICFSKGHTHFAPSRIQTWDLRITIYLNLKLVT